MHYYKITVGALLHSGITSNRNCNDLLYDAKLTVVSSDENIFMLDIVANNQSGRIVKFFHAILSYCTCLISNIWINRRKYAFSLATRQLPTNHRCLRIYYYHENVTCQQYDAPRYTAKNCTRVAEVKDESLTQLFLVNTIAWPKPTRFQQYLFSNPE